METRCCNARLLPSRARWAAHGALIAGLVLAGATAHADPTRSDDPAPERAEPIHVFEIDDDTDVVGEVQYVEARDEDTLLDIARRHGLGYEEIRMANPGVDTWVPGEGTRVTVPTRFVLPDAPREGVVVNLADLRLYYYPESGDRVKTFPVSIGRMDWRTPIGEHEVRTKLEDPAWYPPQSIREQAEQRGETMPFEVPPGPDNPLGRHAILLDLSGYLLHGTNRPWGIGMRATHGCIRLGPEDIAYLYEEMEPGMAVRIVDQPFKAGWSDDGELYIQSFPLVGEHEDKPFTDALRMAVDAVESAMGDTRYRVDRRQLREAVENPDGAPRLLGRSVESEGAGDDLRAAND